MKRHPRMVGLDFDGVLHKYSGYKEAPELGPPIDGALEAVQKLIELKFSPIVFSTRPHQVVRAWLARNGFPPLEVTNKKAPFWVLLDDRAVTFNGDWREAMRQIRSFKPYWAQPAPVEGEP